MNADPVEQDRALVRDVTALACSLASVDAAEAAQHPRSPEARLVRLATVDYFTNVRGWGSTRLSVAIGVTRSSVAEAVYGLRIHARRGWPELERLQSSLRQMPASASSVAPQQVGVRVDVLQALAERCAAVFNVPVDALFAPYLRPNGARERQTTSVTTARSVACYLAHRHLQVSLAEIGVFFGRDHSTVHHAVGRVEKALRADEELRLLVFEAYGTSGLDTATSVVEEARLELESARTLVARLERVVRRLESYEPRGLRQLPA